MENLNVEKKHTDAHDLSVFNDQIEMQTDAVVNGVKYLGQDVIVNNVRIKQFDGAYHINRTDTMLEKINARLMEENVDLSDCEIIDRKWAQGGVNSRTMTFNKTNVTPKSLLGDPIKGQIIIVNSYDGSRKASIMFGLMRLACLNGMVSLDKDTGVHAFKKHTNSNVFEYEYRKLGLFKEAMDNFAVQLQSYANTVVSLDTVRNTLKKTIAKNEVRENQIMEYIDSNNRGSIDKIDLYSVYNGVTEWATHQPSRENAEMNNVYLNRQVLVNKFFDSTDFKQLAA
tara:strand:+ start:41 stop:892 length:852 start_codon:yes stop_codon:yes gene_type:complete